MMKKYPEKLDLHMHSTVSDGTDTPAEIIERVRQAGIEMFSLTDHDAVKGCGAIREELTAADPIFITGAEFSCRDEGGKYHILGYGYDPDSEPIKAIIAMGHGLRMKKLDMRLEGLKSMFSMTFSQEDIDVLHALDNPGKPHLGLLMVRYGYAGTKEQAIKDYINKLHIRTEYIRPETAIEGILGGGGVPVLAHPSYGSGDELILGDEMDERLRRLTGYGLEGVEAFYSGFTPRLTREMLGFAEQYGLYVTAGSDYHGKNKMIPVGDSGYDPETEMPEGMRRFLDRFI